jgi:hypothetical protein
VTTPWRLAQHLVILAQALNSDNISSWVNRQSGTGHEFGGTWRGGFGAPPICIRPPRPPTRLSRRPATAAASKTTRTPALPLLAMPIASRSSLGRASKKTAGIRATRAPPDVWHGTPIHGGWLSTTCAGLQGVIDQKIEGGRDCRTTLMARSLPAHSTKRELINLLNAICYPLRRRPHADLGCLPPLQ